MYFGILLHVACYFTEEPNCIEAWFGLCLTQNIDSLNYIRNGVGPRDSSMPSGQIQRLCNSISRLGFLQRSAIDRLQLFGFKRPEVQNEWTW